MLVAGALVDGFIGLIPGQGVQSSTTAERIAILFGLLPAALLVAGAIPIMGYRLSRRRVAAIQEALAVSAGSD